jgi:hypothetical protein
MNRDEPAFVVDGTQYYGLTKREYAAVEICAEITGRWLAYPNAEGAETMKQGIVEASRVIADALFDELEKEGAK